MPVRLPVLAVLLAALGQAEALKEPEICYILDAVLFVYGIVLTVLYCHLKMKMRKQQHQLKQGAQRAIYEKEESVYTGLQHQKPDTYETLQMHAKPN
ncbi:high affinity immunoglobulin epsilon receptor subunit gamma isoform X2 [Lissotriton helveticus]